MQEDRAQDRAEAREEDGRRTETVSCAGVGAGAVPRPAAPGCHHVRGHSFHHRCRLREFEPLGAPKIAAQGSVGQATLLGLPSAAGRFSPP